MTSAREQELVDALVEARASGRGLASAPWADAVPDAQTAYRVQDAVAASLGWFTGSPAIAWKSGGGSRSAVLTHAPLPPRAVRNGPADFGDLPFHAPAIEAEIALRLGTPVSPEHAATLTHEQAWQRVDAMTVSIEIVDSRWIEGAGAPALLRLADQQSHGALAVGAWVDASPRNWSTQGVSVTVGSSERRQFRGSHALGDPAWLLPIWLRHVTRGGASVPAGTIVTTGTWCGLIGARRGDLVQASFEGIGDLQARL